MRLKLFLPILAACLVLGACSPPRKEITVVIRESGSGTREAFDRAVTDGIHYLEEFGTDGKRIDRNTVYAIVQTKGGGMLSTVAADRYAIGYLSPSAVNDQVRVLPINGVFPDNVSVLSGAYPLSRPFVIFANTQVERTPLCEDFLRYLKSDRMQEHTQTASCVFVTDSEKRSASGQEPIPVQEFTPLSSIPLGERLVIRGSTSLERLILEAARGYAELYGSDASRLFDIQLEGSSVGIKAVLGDRTGNMIGLSSASVPHQDLERFTVAYDALAVIVHRENPIQGLTLAGLYDIFSGKVKYFDELEGAT
ncbi:MAG: substrate-binding domain-containing protein [Clostridia bacterium]|nr:substrate-binding domain-containing protein [Clostridia bacterium]